MVNLFGNGFVGSHYNKLYPSVINERNSLVPQIQQGQILYTISTTDNYNISTNPYIDIDTNLTTLIRVLENCRDRQIVFNFVSSWFVYGASTEAYTEDSTCRPQGFYSITKRTAEQLLIEYCDHYKIPWRIVRLANVIGPGDRGVSVKKNILTYMIRRLKQNLPIELHARGQQKRDYINVRDVATAIDLVMNKGNTREIYNIGTGTSISLDEAITYAAKKIQSQSPIHYIDKGQSTEMVLNVEKITRLGFRTTYSVFDSIDELIFE
jgi:nucleoside-diphosphate-sugar epimerase